MADLYKGFNAICLLETIGANVKNKKLSDKAFRQFIYDSLPEEIKDRIDKNGKWRSDNE